MALLKFRGRRLRLALAFTGAAAWILQGYDQALMNGLLTLPTFVEQFPEIDTTTPDLEQQHSTLQGTAVALYEVGAAFGALACFYFGERFGRKWTTFAGAVVVLIGVILQSTAYSLAQLIVARIVTGLGVGSFTATIPTWVGESSDAHQRGSLIMIEGSAAIFGVMFVGWLEFGLYFARQSSVSFRFPIAFQALFPLIVMIMVPMLEESPRWLVGQDQFEEAKQVLSKLEDEPEDSEFIAEQLLVIRQSLELKSQGSSGNPFAQTKNRHLNRTLIAIGVNVLAQLSGVNVITFYSNTILEQRLGYSAVLSRIISSCLQTWQFLMATTAVFLIDRFGRRRLLITGAVLMCIANAGLAGLQSDTTNKTAAGCSLIFYFLALAAFPIGLFLIPFMYSSEIAPLRIRAKVTAMSGCSNWLANFLVAEVTPIAFSSIEWKYYLVYVCTNLVSVVTFYLFLPETKNRTLEEIDAFFVRSRNALRPVKVAKTMPEGVAQDFGEGDVKKSAFADEVEKV
ncbi:Putative major facilitator, sugar transporter, major facilitator superfamily [Septoria linicola]|uniref:Major facilitator, sugar transporter, major facilitator superfamily n=1 Tax=Septoria linicola TaxID=215465 RepID=A0A9Q9ENG1_9PEZI|nr:Putative major facilitator, sugar transporter, major facilitator superfamily [Septoria linicola]